MQQYLTFIESENCHYLHKEKQMELVC